MAFHVNITGKHPMLHNGEVRRLLHSVFTGSRALRPHVDDTTVHGRVLSGGYSGALVLLVWTTHTGPFVVKAGPTPSVRAEDDNRRRLVGIDSWLEDHDLAGTYGPVEVEVEEQPVEWSSVCYPHIAGKTYSEIDHIVDFSEFARDYVLQEDRDKAPGEASVRSCFDKVVDLLRHGEPVSADSTGRSLASFLPKIPWDGGVRPALMMASALCPDQEELLDFRSWYDTASTRVNVAPVPDERLLHGDARLANILVNRVTADVHLIDFDNGRQGHIYEDLARFELDLILSTAPRHADSHEVIQDELLETFSLALRDNLGLHDVEDPSRHAKCLKMWRQAMSGRLATATGVPGAPVMYRWFLLAECLRRLRWVVNNGEAAAGVDAPSLLRLIGTLRNRISGSASVTPAAIATPSDGLRALHCVAAYVPVRGRERSVNEKRNEAKRSALAGARRRGSTVHVLAETGYSYLATRGAFSGEVQELLRGGGSMQIVISNPAFLEAYGISLSYEDEGRAQTSPPEGLLQAELYEKFRASFRGYSALRDEYKDLIELRLTNFGIGATLLLTDDMYFFEPYFRNARRRRERLIFDTFELQFKAAGLHARTLLDETFGFHWRYSETAQHSEQLEERWRPVRQQVLQTWNSSSFRLRPRYPSSPSTTPG